MRFKPLAAAIALAGLAVSPTSLAGLADVLSATGDEVVVRTGGQINNTFLPGIELAMDDDGDFAVVWAEKSNYNNEITSLLLRRFNADGSPKDPAPIPLADSSMSNFRHIQPALAMDNDGYAIVTWLEQDPANSTEADCQGNLRMVAVDAAGNRPYLSWNVQDDVVASDPDTADDPGGPRDFTRMNCRPHLTTNGNGQFVVVWQDVSNSSNNLIYALPVDRTELEQALADQSGAALPQRPDLGAPGQVNTLATDQPRVRPRAAIDDSGNFIVAWISPEQDHATYPDEEIYRAWARRFAFQNEPLAPLDTEEFRADNGALAADALAIQTDVRLDANGPGQFAIVWHESVINLTPSLSFEFSAKGQLFEASGALATDGSFSRPVDSKNIYATPSVALADTGTLAFGWTEFAGQVESENTYEMKATLPLSGDASVYTLNTTTITGQGPIGNVEGPRLAYSETTDVLAAAWLTRDDVNTPPQSSAERLVVVSSASGGGSSSKGAAFLGSSSGGSSWLIAALSLLAASRRRKQRSRL